MAAVLDWTWVRVQLICFQAKVWPQSANSCHFKVLQDIKNNKASKVCLFSSCQTKNWKKKKKDSQFMQLSTHNFELFCQKGNTACHIFTLHGSQHTPTPPLSALCLRIVYRHSHMTPRGKGARLCASLPRSAAALTLPLFSPCDSGVPGKLLLSLLPCPSAGRTGRLCPGENTDRSLMWSAAPCFWQVKEFR